VTAECSPSSHNASNHGAIATAISTDAEHTVPAIDKKQRSEKVSRLVNIETRLTDNDFPTFEFRFHRITKRTIGTTIE
jgi:hypothetical protein